MYKNRRYLKFVDCPINEIHESKCLTNENDFTDICLSVHQTL